MPVAPPNVSHSSCPGLQPLKLRSSCDGCGTAKVKCDRESPKCGRCTALSLTCTYGPSRKFGKPPRKRLAPNINPTFEKRRRTSRSGTLNHDEVTRMDFGELQNVNKSARHDFSHPATNIVPFSSEINTSFSISGQNQLNSDFYPSIPFEEWPQLDIFGGGLDFLSVTPLEPTSAVSQSSESRDSHSCPRESYEIFRDLICPSPTLHAPESNSATVSAQLDHVLEFNRNAINRLTRVLKCHSCAKSGHRTMVHASIVSRILIWYQQAAGWTGSSSWGPRPSTLASSSVSCRTTSSSPKSSSRTSARTRPESPPSLVQATGFAVEHVPVSIGTFSIEDQNVQAAFRNQLVLSELKKAANLIEVFISQDSAESSANNLGGLCSHLGSWLKSEYSRTVRILISRLKTLHEHLES